MGYEHQTVLLREAVDALQVKPAGCYVDGTFGRGGHSREILRRLGADGRLVGIDRDPEAVAAGEALAGEDSRFAIVHGDFATLAAVVGARGWGGKVDGLLLDLGVSSPQLDDPARGFSFMREGPLDMRMNPGEGQSAADFVAQATVEELQAVFSELGEERFSRRIAQAIVRARAARPLKTTRELAEIVAGAVPGREAGKHPATRVFQALRIHVNRELEQLVDVLGQAIDLLAPGGRLAVISFHSLEDRIVKRFMVHHSRGPELPRGMPLPPGLPLPKLVQVDKAVRPGDAEVDANPRARSAVPRAATLREASMPDLRVARDVLMLGGAVAMAIGSAVGVIYSVHTSRLMVNDLQHLQRDSERAQVEWGQLLLEKSTFGSYTRVEQTAREQLDMYVPSVQEIVVTGQ